MSSSNLRSIEAFDSDPCYRDRVSPGSDNDLRLAVGVQMKPANESTGQEELSNRGSLSSSASNLGLSTIDPSDETLSRLEITSLPSEIIDLIVGLLEPIGIISLSRTCKTLFTHCQSDIFWYRHIQDNVPGGKITLPYPCKTFKELFVAHDPYWFLPKYKIWFSDFFLTGTIIVVRFDPRRGCIEGYRLVAERAPTTYEDWEVNEEVLIHSFEPKIRLHMDQPMLQLDVTSPEPTLTGPGEMPLSSRFSREIHMQTGDHRPGIFSTFLFTRPVDEHPSMELWPPRVIPAQHRVRNSSQERFVGTNHKPHKRSEISDLSFRIRRWMEIGDGIHLGEQVYTYATLDPKLYTPTEDKPWRGIWVGDYSGHGCEFLLMHQPDSEEHFEESKMVQAEDETPDEFILRSGQERICRGSLYAIKLTGDPNVPRGEDTFRVQDLSKTVRIATEDAFKGARIVESEGHVADRIFKDDKYIESQLILISPDKLAQYWVEFGHISFYERIDIDRFVAHGQNI